jgi:hypothetical protein
MLMATVAVVYSFNLDPESTPEVRYSIEGIRALAAGEKFGFIGLENGNLVLLSGEGDRGIETGTGEPVESLLLLSEDPVEILIGTEAPHIYRLAGTEGPAERLDGFDRLEVRSEWHTPWGGPAAVRSMARTPDGWLYADIHVGSIMRSPDTGKTWEPVTPELNEDVHQLTTSFEAPDRVYANTADAVWISDDRGESWEQRAEGWPARYGRAIAVHPDDPDLILATVSDGPHGDNVHGKLFRSEDAGKTWTQVKNGFPESTKTNINTNNVRFTRDGRAWVAADDALYLGENRAREWQKIWTAPERIRILGAPVTE